jgi:hypothetical protein
VTTLDADGAPPPERVPAVGWFAEMPEGSLAPYGEDLDTTLEVTDKMAELPVPDTGPA